MKHSSRQHRCNSGRILALALCTLVPGSVMAEGAVRLLDCVATQVCDAAGKCTPDSQQVLFRMEPVKINDDGSGQYRLQYGKVKTDMTAQSYAGPFYWTLDKERDTLLASSEKEFLWHRLAMSPSPHGTVSFLQCVLSQ